LSVEVQIADVSSDQHGAEEPAVAVLDRVTHQQALGLGLRFRSDLERPGAGELGGAGPPRGQRHRDRTRRSVTRERARDQLPRRMGFGQILEAERTHRGVREVHFATRGEQRDGVLEVLHHRLVVGAAAGVQRAFFRLPALANRRQLGADLVEGAAQILEFLLGQVEAHVELTPAEPVQAALDHVDRAQQPLGQQHRDQRRNQQRGEHDGHGALESGAQLVADQQRGHADADRPEQLIAGEQRLAHLERLVGVNPLQLRERARPDDRTELRLLRDDVSLARRKGVRDRHAVGPHDRRVGHAPAVADRRIENRTEAAVGAQRCIRVRRVPADHFEGALE
jgi:hypothetical protein